MDLIRTRSELERLAALRAGGPVVLVPTMGALHEGHLSLVRRAGELGQVVVSIFVNPTQFVPGEDFARYPRDLDMDLAALADYATAAVFAPSVEEMYRAPDGVTVRPGPRAGVLCGAQRPGHFQGVLTVVAKLFNLVGPDIAVFGRKDAQQCLVIDEMVHDLDFPVALVDAPTRREEDGLAMSSRNRYLSAPERRRATCLWHGLEAVRGLIADGERDTGALEEQLALHLADTDTVDYAEIRALPDLSHHERLDGKVILAVAARVGPARLIDNLVLDVGAAGVVESSLLQPRASVRKERS
ncbi:pantoate--beta-alanine ligase [bacterium]|nr:pantoate--beta-alanine ligase [bacterium]MBU1073020.1 pantoate--beta-alanine ligase [bacterium]MBU1676868.1 pantoate--beta-alanine ligase [bacterium]